jgi:thiol:disulfide interchange protein
MIKLIRILLLAIFLPLQAFAVFGGNPHVKVELVQEEETIQPGRPFWVAVHLVMEEGWHVYWKNPGDAGMPLKVEWQLPVGFEAGPLQWPFPMKFTLADMVGFGYEGEVTLLSQITPPKDLSQLEVPLAAKVNWLVCSSTTCQPGSAPVTLKGKIGTESPVAKKESLDLFQLARAKMPKSHVLAKTLWKDGKVQLEVAEADRPSKSDPIVGVYFFPEQKDVIDHTVEPTVAPEEEGCLVSMKGGHQVGAKGQQLKGVLVLHTQKGTEENVEAFDIDCPIEKENEKHDKHDLIAYTSIGPAIGNQTISTGVTPTNSFTFSGGVSYALLLAFLGGMILNLMPCVLPVLSFKVMSFIQMSGKSRSLTLKHGLAFSFGVLASFWILASIMLILREYGQAVGWGFQLQEPLFVVILASLLFVLALNLFGVFELGLVVASWAGQTQEETKQKTPGYISSFLSGVLATAVATPCTGPFLGSAVGFAFTLPIAQSLLIFTSLGLGMCFPYLLLAAFPRLLKFIPKPGPWMEVFKQLMGFILLATVLWLMWVFSAQTDTLSLICLLAGFLCFSMGAWIYGRGSLPTTSYPKRMVAYALVALCAFAGFEAIIFPRANWYKEDSSIAMNDQWHGWEKFSPERVAELRAQGKPVLIDFTAKWCLICQTNHMVLASEGVDERLEKAGVVKMVADWTKNDPIIAEELSKFGRNSVPLYVLYGTDEKKDPVIMPQVLTPEVVQAHIDQMIPGEEIVLN